MLAIINIITKHPKSVEGTEATTSTGSNDESGVMLRAAGAINDTTSYRVTVSHQQSQGVQNVVGFAAGQKNITSALHDGERIDRINYRSVTEIAQNETFDIQLAALHGQQEQQYADDYQIAYPDIHLREYDINAVWRKVISPQEEYKVQAVISQYDNLQPIAECLPRVTFLPEMAALWRTNPSYVLSILQGKTPRGGSAVANQLAALALIAVKSLGVTAFQPLCGNTNQDFSQRRVDLGFQSTRVFSDVLSIVSGAGIRKEISSSQTYFNGTVENNIWRAFTNAEYKPLKNVSINAGGYFERNSITGDSFSPRVALNAHIDENNTFRFVVTKGNRMPNLLEQNANWSYLFTDLTQPMRGNAHAYYTQSYTSPGTLIPESILSREIGYFGNFPQYGLMIDAKLFNDNLTNLISQRIQLNSSDISNQSDAFLRGGEFQAEYQPSDNWAMHFSYGYLLNDASNPVEQSQYFKNSGALAVSYIADSGWRTSVGIFKYEGSQSGQYSFGKEDITFSKKFKLNGGSTISPTFSITHIDNTAINYQFDINKTAVNRYPNQMQYLLAARFTF